jgi:hypothetical protein
MSIRPRLDRTKVDSGLDPLRDDPRFKAMMAAVEARLAATERGVAQSEAGGGER